MIPAPGRAFAERQPVPFAERQPVPFAERPAALLGGVALAIVFFWGFPALPVMDAPGHAGLIAVRHRFATSPFEQQYFVYRPALGPYSLFRGLGELFVRVVGPVRAIRSLMTLPVLALPASVWFARRLLYRERSLNFAHYALALNFGLMTLFGLASYLLALALVVLALSLFLRLGVEGGARQPAGGGRRALFFVLAPALAATSCLLVVAHGHAYVVFVLLGTVCITRRDVEKPGRRLAVGAIAPSLALAAYAAVSGWIRGLPAGAAAPHGARTLLHFQGPLDKLSLLVTPTLLTRTGIDAAMALLLWAILGAATYASARAAFGRALEEPEGAYVRALTMCLAGLGAAFLALPHEIGWFGFVDGRLLTPMLLVCLLAIRPAAVRAPWARHGLRSGPAFSFGLALLAVVASWRFQREADGYAEILADIPAATRVLDLPIDPDSDVFTSHPFAHFDELALAERPMLTSDAWLHQGTALYPRPGNPILKLPPAYTSTNLHALDWSAYALEDWDYVLVRTRPAGEVRPPPPGLVLVEHRGGWWLFRNDRRR